MNDFMAAAIVAICIMLVALLIFSRSGVVKRPRDLFKSEQHVLIKAKTFMAMHKTAAAVTTLEVGLRAYPKSAAIQLQLEQLQPKTK